ncbi:MAG: HEAT repeat domain-containing protein [Pirellulaceae bacterium]
MRLNAAKTLGWLGGKRAIEPIARILSQAKAEADYGFSGIFKDEEFNEPAPRWREGLVRALGLLKADDQTDLIVQILNVERSVLEVRHAAAYALSDLDNNTAMAALQKAAQNHSFHSIRQTAHDALRARGIDLPPSTTQSPPSHRPRTEEANSTHSSLSKAITISPTRSVPSNRQIAGGRLMW